jgi:hypothetical protein
VQSPSQLPLVGVKSVAVTLSVICVDITVGIVNASECAFGSRHGFPGPGFALWGQSNVTIPDTFVPWLNETLCVFRGATKFAVTAVADPGLASVHVGDVLEFAQAPPHPANVDEFIGVAVNVIDPEGKVPEQVPPIAPPVSVQLIPPILVDTVASPVPSKVTLAEAGDAYEVTVRVVLLSLAGPKLPSPA